MDSDDYLVSAALLSRGQDNITLAADLAERFERCLPNRVQVDWVGRAKRRKLRSQVIDLEPSRFRIDVDRKGATAWYDQIVRGIRLRSEQLDFDTWLNRLAETLNNEATKSVQARLAIQDALS